MKELKKLKEEFNDIQQRILEIKATYNYNDGFSNKSDLEKFISENKEILEKSNNFRKKIETLEWELMTPEEKERKLEVARKIKAKTSGNQSQ